MRQNLIKDAILEMRASQIKTNEASPNRVAEFVFDLFNDVRFTAEEIVEISNKYTYKPVSMGMFSNYYYGRKTEIGSFVKSRNSYESKQFKFDLDTCEAYSYDWWLFCIKIDDVIYFNDSSYSMQTSQHQRMAQNILKSAGAKEHGYKIEYVYFKEGLNHLNNSISNMEFEIHQLEEKIKSPRTRKATNQDRKQRIKFLQKRIKEAQDLKKIIDSQLEKNAEIRRAKEEAAWEKLHKARQLARMKAEKKFQEKLDRLQNFPPLKLVRV